MTGGTMKGVFYRTYGSPAVLRYEDVDKPVPGEDDVLIAVHAASLNPLDGHFMRGIGPLRLMLGLRGPKDIRLGVDVAGRVEAVGRNVTRFRPGDEVCGGCRGAFAEYTCTPETAVSLKPPHVTFEEAASVPVAGLTALQALRDKARVQAGQAVLITGAAGGVGTFAVQIAKAFGLVVTGVCRTGNLDLVRSLGADQVVDYTREDFTRGTARYDAILDCAGNPSLFRCRRVLNPEGVYVGIGGSVHPWIRPLVRVVTALVLSRLVSQTLLFFVAKRNPDDLAVLLDLIETGKVKPVIDRRYGLSEIAQAMAHLETRHARGKIVVTV